MSKLNKFVEVMEEGRYEGRKGYVVRIHPEWGCLVHIRSLLHPEEFELSVWLSPRVIEEVEEKVGVDS